MMLQGGVTYEEGRERDREYIASIMYEYPKVETKIIEMPLEYYNPMPVYTIEKPVIVIEERKEESKTNRIKPVRRNEVKIPARERIDYINKLGNVKDFGVPQVNENIVMKAKTKKIQTPSKDYNEIASLMYPTMEEKSQIQVKKKEPVLLGETSILKEPDMITLADKEYVVKPLDGTFTGAAADLVTDNISGVKKGEPMSVEDALKGVNPNYNVFGNITYRTNCQSGVVIFEARLRGFNVEVDVAYENDIKRALSLRPNIAFIDPKTGKVPEFTKTKAKNEFDCRNWLEQTVKKDERYIFSFQWKQRNYDGKPSAHIITLMRDENNQLKYYDPQNGRDFQYNILSKIQYKFDWTEDQIKPQILRVDDKELNKKVLNQISKPARKVQ